jgi:hypothetical protein
VSHLPFVLDLQLSFYGTQRVGFLGMCGIHCGRPCRHRRNFDEGLVVLDHKFRTLVHGFRTDGARILGAVGCTDFGRSASVRARVVYKSLKMIHMNNAKPKHNNRAMVIACNSGRSGS